MDQPAHPGLYLHIPFCSRICPYCDFAVLTGGRERRREFVRHLLAEIEMSRGEATGCDTLYFGGGTPSALDPDDLQELLEGAAAACSAEQGADPVWIFFEANPEDLSPARLQEWRSQGVRTLSLGVQSFDEQALRFLGRRHDSRTARRSVELALQAGFDAVSIDLIYGLPGETPGAWRQTLAEAVRLGPEHISCYQLTIHSGTPFGFRARRGVLRELPEEDQAERFTFTHRFLGDSGYEGYEVSSFARAPRHRSRHNRKYWDHTPYLGLGPSAHSFDGRRRWWNERKLAPYQQRVAAGERPVAGSEILSPAELALEALMLGFRTAAGVNVETMHQRHGVDLVAGNAPLIERLVADGLLLAEAGVLRPTLRGLAVADSLSRSFDIGEPV